MIDVGTLVELVNILSPSEFLSWLSHFSTYIFLISPNVSNKYES